jgi:hypothetical protein
MSIERNRLYGEADESGTEVALRCEAVPDRQIPWPGSIPQPRSSSSTVTGHVYQMTKLGWINYSVGAEFPKAYLAGD